MDDFDEYISLEEVFEAYYECRRNKRKTFNALSFESDYEVKLVELWREINTETYEIGKSIAFVVTRPVKREVFAADFRDRVVHHLVVHRLEPLFEEVFIDDNYNCRKEKGVLYGVKRLHQQVKECSDNYTKDCYIAKCDLQGFFMSMHKPTLWRMLERFIWENYTGIDMKILLYLVKKIVLHNPELHCERRSPLYMWNDLAANKSLFTAGHDYGLPIGNLTSQMFANFYLHGFDQWMKAKYKWYGRYVDDFYFVGLDKSYLLNDIPEIRRFLKDGLSVTLHPKKLYLQHYRKGCKFIGSVVKGELMYVSNRTVSNFYDAIRKFNRLAEENPYYTVTNAEHFISSINSYFGFLKHYNSYAIRRKLATRISPAWFKVMYISGHFEKVVCKNEYKTCNILKRKCKDRIIFKTDNYDTDKRIENEVQTA